MIVLNEQKLAFRDMTPEERSEIVEAWLSGQVQGYIPYTGEWEDCGPVDFIYTLQAYRTRPRQLVIPWEWVDKSIVGASMDKYGDVYFYKKTPVLDLHNGCYAGDWVYATAFNIDTNGVDWKTSYTPRPEE